MAIPYLSAIRPPVVASLPSGVKGDCVVLTTNGHLYTHNGTTWVDNGSGGGGSGTAVVNFGAYPGSAHTTVAVTGQTGILTTSNVSACVRVQDNTAEHNTDEHIAEALKVIAGNVTAGVGFTISAECLNARTYGSFNLNWSWE